MLNRPCELPPRWLNYCLHDLANAKRRIEETRDGLEPWASQSLSTPAPYAKPGVRAKTIVSARFGRARPATSTAVRPTTLVALPEPDRPASRAVPDAKPHIEALGECLGLGPNP